MSGPTTPIGGMPGLPPEFLDALQGMKTSRYGAAAATTLYIYDILITFDLEVEHVWRGIGFTLPMLFYFLNRYFALIFFIIFVHTLSEFRGPLSDAVCKIPFMHIGFIFAHISWTGVMALRVCALWKQQTILVVVIRILWLLTNMAVVVCVVLSGVYGLALFSYHEEVKACIPDKTTMTGVELAGLYGTVGPLIFETFLAALTIIKAFDFQMQASRFSFRTLPFFYRVVARDGVLYFLVTTVVTMVILVVSFTHLGPEVNLFLAIYWALLSSVISRLALNLRRTYCESQQVTKSASFGVTDVTDRTNPDFGISADFGRHGATTKKDIDTQVIQSRFSGAVDTKRGSTAITEPEEAGEGDQYEVEQDANSTDPPLAMQRLRLGQDGVDVV